VGSISRYFEFFSIFTEELLRRSEKTTVAQVVKQEKRKPSTGRHPEPVAKDLCPEGKARVQEYSSLSSRLIQILLPTTVSEVTLPSHCRPSGLTLVLTSQGTARGTVQTLRN